MVTGASRQESDQEARLHNRIEQVRWKIPSSPAQLHPRIVVCSAITAGYHQCAVMSRVQTHHFVHKKLRVQCCALQLEVNCAQLRTQVGNYACVQTRSWHGCTSPFELLCVDRTVTELSWR